MGKTLGVLCAWVWHRLIRKDDNWPRRLVWCLPMRVLVEQTRDEVEQVLMSLGLLWDDGERGGRVGVHVLMGGADAGEWSLYPEECAVLIGTQDMLLSRALNRGFGTRGRARWPMEFGLLNQDCLWVMDEVQLMDVGLATSAQLQAFREEERAKTLRPVFTWWMSATLQPDWLRKSPDTRALCQDLPESRIPADQRAGHLWDDVEKPCALATFTKTTDLTKRLEGEHRRLTLVVLNTVTRALDVFDELQKLKSKKGSPLADTEIRLIHSRFRPAERAAWRGEFLNKSACLGEVNRIVVATQVVEAGVDISADLLVSELAPWPSLVQRFGRCARWGGRARVLVADFGLKGDKALPYDEAELDASRGALDYLADVSPKHLEAFEETHPEWLPLLYPYDPPQLLLRHELDELFDTTTDLTGADIDISRFIRSGEERDLHVFWAAIPAKDKPTSEIKPLRDALCAIPFIAARNWLCGKESGNAKAPRLKPGMRAWVWDWLEGQWRIAERRDLYPGQTVLVDANCGGYDPTRGWWPESVSVTPVSGSASITPEEQADSAQDDESLSEANWKTIATHGAEAGRLAAELAFRLAPNLATLYGLAGRWHDAGKAHPAFQGSIKPPKPTALLAKAPEDAWLSGRALYPMADGGHRPGFRHELASTLALFAVLQRHQPDHPALLGPWRELLEKAGLALPAAVVEGAPTSIEREILALTAEQFDLLAYLVCSHHGKVRLAWHACPADQAANDIEPRIRGIRQGDELPALELSAADGSPQPLPASRLDLAPAAAGLNPHTGRGWTERVLGLLQTHGPFTLAWLEALLRAADQRASRSTVADPLLENPNAPTRLEGSSPTLAEAPPGGAIAHSSRPDTAQSGAQHGLRGAAGGRADAGGGTQAPDAGAARMKPAQITLNLDEEGAA